MSKWHLYIFTVLMFVWVKKKKKNARLVFISACASILRVDVYPLGKAEVSREYRQEKKKKKKHKQKCSRKKGKYLSWLERGSEQLSSPHALSVRT